MAQHPPEAGAPATRECTDCGTVVGLLDGRAGAPQPRNATEYATALAAAGGVDVVELDAATALPGMTVWHFTDWRVVTHVVIDGAAVDLHMAAPDGTAVRHTSIDTPLYRLP
jgi:hypothetical protein